MHLSREIRFALVRDHSDSPINSWAGWPASAAIAPHLILQCIVTGIPDTLTGYICNVKTVDSILRKVIVEEIIPNYEGSASIMATHLLQKISGLVTELWNVDALCESLTLHVSPFLNFQIKNCRPNMVEMNQQFEFSAAHRLHCDALSVEENQNLFGKCNNPEGHGHNYVVEVGVLGEPNSTGELIPLHEFEKIIKDKVIDKLDHKHLNRDVDYFSTINPSVENITQAIWDWLVDEFQGLRLSRIRVYETPKTWAEIRI